MDGKGFRKELRTFRGGDEVFSENFCGKLVFKVHSIDFGNPGIGIEHGFESVEENADGRRECVKSEKNPFYRPRIGTIGRII